MLSLLVWLLDNEYMYWMITLHPRNTFHEKKNYNLKKIRIKQSFFFLTCFKKENMASFISFVI